MKTITMIKENKEYEVKKFKTRTAAENFINRKSGRELVWYRSGEYYASI